MTDLDKLKALRDAGEKWQEAKDHYEKHIKPDEFHSEALATLARTTQEEQSCLREVAEVRAKITGGNQERKFYKLAANSREALSNIISYVEKLEEALQICIMDIENFGYEDDLFKYSYNTAKQALAEKLREDLE